MTSKMTSKLTILFAALLIAGCGSNSNNKPVSNSSVAGQKIESCWKQAGLQGDIYKFLTPAEVLGLQSIAGATDLQVSQFKACASA